VGNLFTKFKIGLNPFGAFCKIYKRKTEMKKRKEQEKEKKAEG
jgi:hypothetical protein